jgi:ribosome production factor 2
MCVVVIQGRIFEGHLLDLYEFGVSNYQSIASFPGDKKAFGAKPMIVFLGDQWEIDSTYINIQNLLLDYFRGFKPDKLSIRGVDHVITCAVSEGVISIRGYFVNYQKANNQVNTRTHSLSHFECIFITNCD